MAENKSSLEFWEFQSRESDQRFYRTLNELRVEMGLLPVNYSNSMEDQVYDRTILVKIHFLKYSISCRELDMVFSRFGALEKLETLSPRSEFHSRICFQSIESARMAFDSLNHKNVYDDCCELELFLMREIMIEPSKNVEKECKRFDSSLQGTQYNVGNQVGDRTLLVQIHLLEYNISHKELELVFSKFGILENIEILGPDVEFHSKVRFGKKESALEALDSLNGRNVYDGCCKLELILEKELLGNQSEDQCPTFSKEFSDEICFADEDLPQLERDDEIKIVGPEIVPSMVVLAIKNSVFDAYNLFDEMSSRRTEAFDSIIKDDMKRSPTLELDESSKETLKVISNYPKVVVSSHMFVELICDLIDNFGGDLQEYNHLGRIMNYQFLMPYDRGKMVLIEHLSETTDVDVSAELQCEFGNSFGSINSFIFYPGGILGDGKICAKSPFVVILSKTRREFVALNVVFDPGGIGCSGLQVFCWQHRKLQRIFACLLVGRSNWIFSFEMNINRKFKVEYEFADATCMVQLLWVCFELPISVDKRDFVQWVVQASDVLAGYACANLAVEPNWKIEGIASSFSDSSAWEVLALVDMSSFPYDRGKLKLIIGEGDGLIFAITLIDCCWVIDGLIFVFDPGGIELLQPCVMEVNWILN